MSFSGLFRIELGSKNFISGLYIYVYTAQFDKTSITHVQLKLQRDVTLIKNKFE